jgi:WD40 repeat protein
VESEGPGGEVIRARAQVGIRAWISKAGQTLLKSAPVAILTAMTAAALAPILVPALAGTTGPEAVQGLLQQVGGAGTGYLAAIVQEVAGRLKGEAETTGITEETLREILQACLDEALSGPQVAEARTAITAFVQAVNGLDAAIQAALDSSVPGLWLKIAQAVNDLSQTISEFGPLHADLLDIVNSIRRDTTDIRSTTRDTNDEVRRLSIEFTWLRLILLRRPAVGTAYQASFAGHADGAGVPSPDGICPYPGLAPFSELDAAWFHGRDRLIALLVSEANERLYGNTPLVVMGASGAGKSSVLRAGLLPGLLNGGLTEPGSEDWPWMTMTPGRFPLRDLALRLADLAKISASQVLDQIEGDPGKTSLIVRQALLTRDERSRRGVVTTAPDLSGDRGSVTSQRRLVLIIDQFEEVFTLCHDGEQRKLFIDSVCAIASGTRYGPPPALVVIGLHTAFMDQCTAHPELAPALDNSVIVGPMTSQELRKAIESPAQQAGLTVGPGLVETVLGDIGAVESRVSKDILTYDPGKLPLLAHALLETWKRRDGSQLTVAAYQAAGGIRHALADTAEHLYESLDDAGKQVAKRLLLHMVALGDAEDTRRTMSRTALLGELPDADQDIAAHLLGRLEEKRLVTASENTVQIAHEALLRHWPRLADWLHEDRDWRREEQRLAEYAREWTDNAHDPDRLLRGGALAAVQEKLDERRRAGLSKLEEALFTASEKREARGRRARRSTMILLIVLAAVAGGFAAVAEHDRTVASWQQALAQSRQLAAEAAELRASDPEVSLLLSLEAYRVQPSYEAVSSLLSAQLGFFAAALDDQAGPANAVAYDPAAPLLAVAGQENAVTVWNTGSHRLAFTLRGQSPFYAVAFNQSGSLLAGAEQDGATIVWNMATRREAGILGASGGPSVNAVAFDPHGQIIATAGDGETITLWNTRTLRKIRTFNIGATVNGIAISPDGTRLAAACSDHDVRVWNLASGSTTPLVLSGHTGPALAVAFSPVSPLLASSSDDGTIRLWDSHTGASRGILSASTSPVDALAFNSGGTLLASGGADDAVRLWDVSTLTQVNVLTGPASTVKGVAFSANGQALASADTSATVGIWDVTAPPRPGSKPTAAITSTSRPGGTIATAGDGEEIALWKPGEDASYAALPTPVSAGSRSSATPDMALSPDGSTLAVAPPGNQITLWNTRTRHKIDTLTAPGALTSVAYRPVAGPAVVAAGSPDGYIYIWGAGTSQPVKLSGGLQAPVTSVAFSPNGTLLAAGSEDGTFLLAQHRSTGKWTVFSPTGGPLNAVETVVFSLDGRMLATGSSTGTVQLWNITNPSEPVRLKTLTVSAQSVISVAFSPSGELAASYDDGTIRLWDIRNPASAVPLATLSGLASPTSITWETDPQYVSGAAADGTLLTWDTEPSDIANRICQSRLSGNADDLIPYLTGVSYHPICP